MDKEKPKQNYEYINRFADENYDRITIIVPKGSKERIRKAAKAHNQNMSDFMVSLMPRSLVGRWKKKGREEELSE